MESVVLLLRWPRGSTPIASLRDPSHGTAKGGVIVAVSEIVDIPVRYIGIGEQMDDLREFNAEDFVDAMFED